MKKLTCEILEAGNEGTLQNPIFCAEMKLTFDNNSSIYYLQYETNDVWGLFDDDVSSALSEIGISDEDENFDNYVTIVEEFIKDCEPKKIDFADLINDYLKDEVKKVDNYVEHDYYNDTRLQVYCSIATDKTYVMICKDDKLDVYITFDSYVDYVDFLKSDEIWDDQVSSLADFRITYNVEQYIN
jgi:hypothetical protein